MKPLAQCPTVKRTLKCATQEELNSAIQFGQKNYAYNGAECYLATLVINSATSFLKATADAGCMYIMCPAS